MLQLPVLECEPKSVRLIMVSRRDLIKRKNRCETQQNLWQFLHEVDFEWIVIKSKHTTRTQKQFWANQLVHFIQLLAFFFFAVHGDLDI